MDTLSHTTAFRIHRPEKHHAFTLVELLVSVAVLAVLLLILMSITNSVSKTVTKSSSIIDAYAKARSGFDIMQRKLGRATLNTYWDYDDPLNPTVYIRQSNLHLLIRQNTQNPDYGQEIYFQSPETYSRSTSIQSTEGLLNACSFFIQFCSDSGFRPTSGAAPTPVYRYRLMHGIQPTENLSVYSTAPALIDPLNPTWISTLNNGGTNSLQADVTPIANNVIALIAWPQLPEGEDAEGDDLTTNYTYSSKLNAAVNPQPVTANQLPPIINVTLITITENAALRLDNGSTPPDFIESALRSPSGRFTDVTKYREDLDAVTASLTAHQIEYRVLSTSIALRESKWSKASP